MPGLRSAQSRAIAAGALGLLLLAGVATTAVVDRAPGTTLWLVIGLSAAAFVMVAATLAVVIVSVVRPLASLRASVRAIAAGDPEARAKVSGPEEIASLARDFNAMADTLSAKAKEYIDTTNLTGVIILRTDKDNRVSLVNDVMCEFLGRSREEILGTPILDYLHPEDAPSTVRAILRMVQSKGLVTGIMSRHVTPTGMRVTEWNGYPIFDEQGRYAGVHGTGRDITKRKKAEEALRLQSEITQNMAEAVYLIRASDGVIVYTNPAFERLFGYGPGEMIGKHVSVVNAPTDKSSEETAREIMATLDRTGVWRGEILSIKKDGTLFWSYANVSTFDHPGHGRVWVTYHMDITERKRAEEALRGSEKRYRLLAENATDVIWTMDTNLRFTYMSPSVTRLRGYTVEEAMAQTLEECLTSASLKVAKKAIAAEQAIERMEGKDLSRSRTMEVEQTCKDGSTVWVEGKFAILRDPDGQAIGTMGITRDITERKQAEEALRESEAELSAIYENAPPLMILVDRERRVHKVNYTAMKFSQRSAEDMIGRRGGEALRCVHSLDDPEGCGFGPSCGACPVRSLVVETFETGNDHYQVEAKLELASGEGEVTVLASTVLLSVAEGERVLVCIEDITERKRAEEALAAKAQEYVDTTNLTGDIIIRVDRDGRLAFLNDAACEFYGRPREELLGVEHADYVHPDDMASVTQLIHEGIPSRDLVKGFVNRMITPMGTRVVEWNGYGLFDEEGHYVGLQGTGRDITERKRAEEALRESEQRFSRLSGATFEGLVIHEKGKILDANPAFARMFGYELSEVIGMHALDFTAPQSRDLLWQGIISRRKEPFEALGLRKDGSTLVCELRGKDIPYQERMVTVVAIWDITERKRAEKALQKVRDDIESRVERRVQEVNGYNLTFRELTVLHLVAAGQADKEIATVLGISPLTAHKHLANILDKMGAASRTEAGVRALREGLLD